MLRYVQYVGLALLLAFLVVSCDNDQPTSPGDSNPNQPLILHVSNFDNAIYAQEDELYPVAFEVQVTDTFGFPVEGVSVNLTVVSGPGGIAPSAALTNPEGIVEALFYVNVPYGVTSSVIRACAGSDMIRESISMRGEPVPKAITFQTLFDTLDIVYGLPYEGEVTARVLDKRGNGITGRNVHISVIEGEALVEGVSETDENGALTTSFTLDGTWFGNLKLAASLVEDNPGEADATALDHLADELGTTPGKLRKALDYEILPVPKSDISRFIAGTDDRPLTDTLSIEVQLARQVGLTILTPDVTVKTYSGVKSAVVRARLSDEDGAVLANEIVEFTCDREIASIGSLVRTDEFGIAETEVFLTGTPGTTPVTARFASLNLIDSIDLTVEARTVGSVTLELINHEGKLWADETYKAETTVTGKDGEPIVGAIVRFGGAGDCLYDFFPRTDSLGKVVYEFSWPNSTFIQLISYVNEFDVSSNCLDLQIYGKPVLIVDELVSDTSDDAAHIYDYKFQLLDARCVELADEWLHFSITSGRLSDNYVATDENGRGSVSIFCDCEPVSAVLVASWENYSKHVELFLQKQATFDAITARLEDLEITASNTGEPDTTTVLHIDALDVWSNPYRNDLTVFVEFLNQLAPPLGASVNNHGSLDSVIVQNGSGSATLYSGTQSGGKQVRVYTWRDEARLDTVEVRLSTLVVEPGPATGIDIDPGDRGLDIDGQLWGIPLSARAWDNNRNPINAIPRFAMDSEYAFISGDTLVYPSSSTFEPVEVDCQVITRHGSFHRDWEYTLPLQEGELTLNIEPEIYLVEDEDDETAEITVQAVLRDGHEVLINNAPIVFRASRGNFLWLNHHTNEVVPYDPDNPAIKHTGIRNDENNEENGTATVYLWVETFDPWLPPYEDYNTQISAQLVGYEDVMADPKFVIIARHP